MVLRFLILLTLSTLILSCSSIQKVQVIKPSKTIEDTISTQKFLFDYVYLSNNTMLTNDEMAIKMTQMPQAKQVLQQSNNNFTYSYIADALSILSIGFMFNDAKIIPATIGFVGSELASILLWRKSIKQKRKAVEIHNNILKQNN
ncbi:MAG: hypothetical protein ACK4K9_07045 [Bacteroidia bacterium]